MRLSYECGILTLEVEYHYSKGTKDYFDQAYGNWLPGDPAEVEIKEVYLERSNERIDIMPILTDAQLSDIMEACLEHAESEPDI